METTVDKATSTSSSKVLKKTSIIIQGSLHSCIRSGHFHTQTNCVGPRAELPQALQAKYEIAVARANASTTSLCGNVSVGGRVSTQVKRQQVGQAQTDLALVSSTYIHLPPGSPPPSYLFLPRRRNSLLLSNIQRLQKSKGNKYLHCTYGMRLNTTRPATGT